MEALGGSGEPQVPGSLTPLWETLTVFLAPGCGLAQSHSSLALGGEELDGNAPQSFSN